MSYKILVGITVFGEPIGYSADALIEEYKQFIEANTQFILNIVVNKYSALADDEFVVNNTTNCKYPAPWLLHSDTKLKLPMDVQINMILYDYKGYTPCYGGGTWGGDVGINGVPFIIVPLGAFPATDNLPSCVNSICTWKRSLSQVLVHEWIHGVNWLLTQKGFMIPSIDNCIDYGYTGNNDPGWQKCMKYILSQINVPMYESVGTLVTKTFGFSYVMIPILLYAILKRK